MKLTIITINYNHLEGLKKTFDSVFMQTYRDFEYIVIDGGSSDGSKEYIEKHSDKITHWVSEADRGVYHAMNKGLEVAQGEYVLFINSGDELYDVNTIDHVLPQLQGEDIITGDLNFISEEKNYIGIGQDKVSFVYMYHNTIWHPSSFIKRECFEKVGFYDESLKICSDWMWFLLAIYKHQMKYKKINLIISKFYLDGISSSSENQKLIKQEREETFRRYFHFSDVDFKKMDELLKNEREFILLQNKLDSLKNSRLLKLLYRLGIFKAYKYL